MSKLFFIVKTIALLGLAFISASSWAGRGYVFDSTGSVSIAVNGKTPRLAVINDAVATGMVIRTGENSHAVLKFEDGQVISMQSNTTLKVREYTYIPSQVEKSKIILSMYKGGVRFIPGLVSQNNRATFRLATPSSTIRSAGAEFMVVLTGGETYCQVVSGSIALTNKVGTTRLAAGKTALISSVSSLASQVSGVSVPPSTFARISAISVPRSVPSPAPPEPSVGNAVDIQPTGSEAAQVTSEATLPDDNAGMVADSSKDRALDSSQEEPSDFYVGIQLGSANYRYSSITNNGQVGLGWLVGYAINERFSVEIKHNNLGGFESTKSTLKGSSLGVNVVGYYQTAEKFALFGKLGIVTTELKETAKPGFTGNAQYDNTGLTFGFGGQYNIGSKVGIRGGLDVFPVGDKISTQTTAGLLYIGSVFRF